MNAQVGYPQIGSNNTINQDNVFGDNVVNLATGLLNEQGKPLTNANMTLAIMGIQQNPQLAQRLMQQQGPQYVQGTTAPLNPQPAPPSQLDTLGIESGPAQPAGVPAPTAPSTPLQAPASNTEMPAATPNAPQASQSPANGVEVTGGSPADVDPLIAGLTAAGAYALARWMKTKNPADLAAAQIEANNPQVAGLLPAPVMQELKPDLPPQLPPPESEPLDVFQMRPTNQQRESENNIRTRGMQRQQKAANASQVPEGTSQMRPTAETMPIDNPLNSPNGVEYASGPNGPEPVAIEGEIVQTYDTAPWDERQKVFKTSSGRWFAADGTEIPSQYIDNTGNLIWNRGNQIPPDLVNRVKHGFAAAARMGL